MNILVTGAAGYIGSVISEKLVEEGHIVIALDNLSRGHRKAVHPKAKFIQADIGDAAALNNILRGNSIDVVMHLAADCQVGESMIKPAKYFQNNLAAAITMLNVLIENDVKKIVFSSSCATYGIPATLPINENTPAVPANPYGESKLAFEKILHWYNVSYGLVYIALRYFNAAGASANYGCEHEQESLIIPNALKTAMGTMEYLSVFGDNYPTPDGSCVRDYIHVEDIADAHILAMKHLNSASKIANSVYNLGNGTGYSVLQVVNAVRRITGINIRTEIKPRRPGDPPILVADASKAKLDLGWEPRRSSLDSIISSAWEWKQKHPRGYES